MDGEAGFFQEEVSGVKGTGGDITDDCGNGGAGDPPSKTENHYRIQNDIGDSADQIADHGFFGSAFSSENITECSAEHDKGSAKCNVA